LLNRISNEEDALAAANKRKETENKLVVQKESLIADLQEKIKAKESEL